MKTASQKLDDVIHEIAFEKPDDTCPTFESHALLAGLQTLGTELWIDTGDLEQARSIWKKEMTALTTNNTLANQVVQSGTMDEVIHDTVQKIKKVASDLSDEEFVTEVGFVINCKIAMRLVQAFKVKVSVELHPSMSRDIGKTLNYARRYQRVCPEFFIIKIPLTPEGYLSVRKLRREGMPINFTLGFSARQNYLAARLSNPTYVNVFLGRLNQVVVDNAMGSGDLVGEKVTLATQEAVLETRKNFSGVSTKLIGASIRNGEQVEFLAGLDVMTIPPKAMQQFVQSAKPAGQLKNNIGKSVETEIASGSPWSSKFPQLWKVDPSFKEFVDALLKNKQLDHMSGEELVEFCRGQEVDLFYDFSREDLKKIYDHGKIPRFSDWPDQVSIDNLMTQSALQSFTKDQNALDERIRSFLK